ncbi:alpha-amylase family glycosyl hydrolase [Agarivorans aestuarii]|uniref:Alpha-amylase family glycosyl hydrolase n=1 Tax=Agarivorans aestuarii TaxID=1563703 RepID=A0ABU7G824_9ALTE|nr:alpha-amylase family glycosyl hydrolase [Agarivorans aestuarii]MEE1675554.1 alpha-amylase family glycosyl hydrolase [Agarivorans aestuarii]
MRNIIISFMLAAFAAACSSTSQQESESVALNKVTDPNAYKEQIEVTPPSSSLPERWWESAVFYEVFVRAYYDSSGDGHGDIQGLISKLDYLQELGVTGLWLMPVTESEFNTNGYDVKNIRAIEQDYGSMEDFQQLVDEAHQRGIGVIMDLVVNHSSSANPIFQDAVSNPNSKYRDWFIWADSDLGWGRPWDRSATVWHPSDHGYYYGLFFDFLPDWNFRNPEVVAYMKDSAKFWLNMGVDGFRVDAASHLIENGNGAQENQPDNHLFYQEFRQLINHYPNAYIVAEAPFTGGAYMGDGNNEFHSNFCFKCSQKLMYGAKNGSKRAIQAYFSKVNSAPEGANFATLLSNHDPFAGDRAVTAMGGNLSKAKLAASIMLTGPGIPFVYYGEEIGMTAIDRSLVPWDDAVSRIPMQWDASDNAGFTTGTTWRNVNPDYPQINVAQQIEDPNSMLTHYQKMIALRNQHPALASGEFELLKTTGNSSRHSIAFLRKHSDETLLVVVNLSDEEIVAGVNLAGTSVANKQFQLGQELLSGLKANEKLAEQELELTLPAYSIKVFFISLN